MKTLIDMAREANDYATAALGVNAIPREWRALRDKQFAALVREDDAERIAILEQDNANCRKAVSDLMDDIRKRRAAMQAVFDKANAFEIDSDECLDFDECTAMLVPLDSYNGLIEAITALREALEISSGGTESSCGGMAQPAVKESLTVETAVSDYDREFWGDGQPQGEWVDLTDDELDELQNREFSQNDWIWFYTRAVITKFKEKNTQPVVPQGEPAGYIADDSGSIIFATSTDAYPLNWVPVYTILPTAPNLNCKSVQKRLATSWGYVRKEEYDMAKVAAAMQTALGAMLTAQNTLIFKCGGGTRPMERETVDDLVNAITAVQMALAQPTIKESLTVQDAGMVQPVSHVWDGVGERCIVCGDKDWMASQYCPGKLIAPPTAAQAARQMRDAAAQKCIELMHKQTTHEAVEAVCAVGKAIAALPIPGENK